MDSDYYSQTQNSGTKISQNASAGTILQVQMKNFMCHDNLEVTLNPRINFICGKNGSGKSAIQTALAVGLGGKALSTNRGSSIKALIKNDKNTSTIVIIISNMGPLAFKPEIYGNQIQVVRTFSQSSQGYKIKNALGKVVSSEKKELDNIVAQFNIQTDNPVCILHQDVARSFLNSSDPKNKFKFYMKASRFDDISKLYSESTIRVLAISETIDGKFEIVKEAFSDVIEMRRKLKTLEDARNKQVLRQNLEHELLWARIHDSNLQLQELQKKKETEMLAKTKTERRLERMEENKLKDTLKELEEKIIVMENSVRNAKEEFRPVRERFSRKREELSNIKMELAAAKKNVIVNNRKYEKCLLEIQNLNKNGPEKKLQQEKLKAEKVLNEKNLEAIKAAEDSFEHDKKQLQDTIENSNRELQSVVNRYDDLQRRQRKRQNDLSQMTKNASSLNIYGEVMVRIVDEINKAVANRKFQQKPVGPIGIHIKVQDPTWAGAVENFLGRNTLSSFCVDNQRDSATLSNILKSVCSRAGASQPTIVCSKFLNQVHDIRQHETGTRRYTNLSRALNIDHPVVANCLIDQNEVESVLLIPTNNEAYELLDEERKVPRNCKKAFTLTGDQFFPAPNYKSYSSQRAVTQAVLLQANQEDVIRQLKNEVNEISREMVAVENEMKTIRQQVTDTTDSLRRNESELNKLRKQRHNIEKMISNLKDSLVQETEDTNVSYFHEEAEVLRNQIQQDSDKVENLTRAYRELETEYEETKTSYEELQKTVTDADKEKAPILGEIQQLKSTIHEASTESGLLRQKIKEHDNKVTLIETEMTELSELVNTNTENASQVCEPVNTQRSVDEINRELRSVVSYLTRLEAENGGSLEQIRENYIERQEAFNTVNDELNDILSLVKKTRRVLKTRKSREKRMQLLQSTSAKHNFQSLLNERDFDGKLEFDFEAKTLEIKVKTEAEARDTGSKKLDTSSLSGGEKSYSTVCFIMALWQEMELPFHFLDEFDVFMDALNRRIVMDLLIAYAQGIRQQFVFLTPLDMSSISASDNITVHRLESPRQ